MYCDRTINLGGREFKTRYGHNAMVLIEEHLCKLVTEGVIKSLSPQLGVGVWDMGQLPRRVDVQITLWAGLETARKKYNTRPELFTLEEVGDLIDEAGGIVAVNSQVMEAFKIAFPEFFPTQESKTEEKNEHSETEVKNDQEEPTPAPNAGTRSSTRRSKSA